LINAHLLASAIITAVSLTTWALSLANKAATLSLLHYDFKKQTEKILVQFNSPILQQSNNTLRVQEHKRTVTLIASKDAICFATCCLSFCAGFI
jgi:hypothetical protein